MLVISFWGVWPYTTCGGLPTSRQRHHSHTFLSAVTVAPLLNLLLHFAHNPIVNTRRSALIWLPFDGRWLQSTALCTRAVAALHKDAVSHSTDSSLR